MKGNLQKSKIIIFFLAVFMLNSCSLNNCDELNGIKIGKTLIFFCNDKKIPYCEYLEKSLESNTEFIKKISTLKIEDAAAYDHGEVLLNLIEKVSVENYINAIKNLNSQDKKLISDYLKAGLEYGDFPENKKIPQELIIFLNNGQN